MKVIKEGKLRLATCPYCDTILQYDINKDIKSKDIEVFSIDCHKKCINILLAQYAIKKYK